MTATNEPSKDSTGMSLRSYLFKTVPTICSLFEVGFFIDVSHSVTASATIWSKAFLRHVEVRQRLLRPLERARIIFVANKMIAE